MALPLRENPVFLQWWRGGSHAGWRRAVFSPLVEAGVGMALFLGFVWLRWPMALTLGEWLIVVTALSSTPVAIRQMGVSLRGEWRRGQMHDLLMTPLTGRELAEGILGGAMAGWGVWVPLAAAVSLALILWGPGDLGATTFAVRHTRLGLVEIWLYGLMYTGTQTLWASGVVALTLTRWRSAAMVQLEAALILMVSAPLIWIVIAGFGAIAAGQGPAHMVAVDILTPPNWIHAAFQIAKALLGALALRYAVRHFHERLVALLDAQPATVAP